MDSSTLSTFSSAFGVLAPVLFVLLFVWVWWRTGSRHVLVYRLWQLVHGSQEISDPEVRAFINEQTSLMSFRFVTGIRVRTLEHARQLIQWTHRHDVEMRTVSLCGEYFDLDLRQVRVHKLPSPQMQAGKLLLFAIVVFAAFVGMAGAYTDRAILKFKESNRWFIMTTDQARVAWPLGANTIQKGDCSANISANAVRSAFTEKEVGLLCEVFSQDDSSKFVKEATKDQRQSFVFLAIAMVWAAWLLFWAWASGYEAKQLALRQLDVDTSGNQLSLGLVAHRGDKPTT